MTDYLRAADPYPLQGEKSTRLSPFYDALREGRLVTTGCSQCGRRHWPPRVVCPHCLFNQLDWIALPQRGTVHAFTIQDTGVPPGFPRPLIFAVVNLDGLRLFTRLVDTDVTVVRRGMTIELSPSKVTSDPQGEQRYLPTFRAVRGEGTT